MHLSFPLPPISLPHFFMCLCGWLACGGSLWAQFPTSSTHVQALAAYQEGQARLRAGDLEEALVATRQALRADTAYIDACDQMAEVFRLMGQYDSAIVYYERSQRLYPRNLRAFQGLAVTYQMQENFPAAIEQYRAWLSHYPGYPQAYYGLAKVYYGLKQYEQAIEYSEQAMRIYLQADQRAPAADARMLAGQSYMNQGQYKQAIRYFKASERQVGARPYFPYYLGFCYLRLGKKDKALNLLREAETRGFQLPNQVREEMRQ